MDDSIRVKTIVLVGGNAGEWKVAKTQTGESRLRSKLLLVRSLWAKLHSGIIHDEATLAEWELSIPQYGCQCKAFYQAWKADNAPDFSSLEAFFAWGVRLHNAVNAKLGKPQITLEEAYRIWRGNPNVQVGEQS
jgi:hypothetical protein